MSWRFNKRSQRPSMPLARIVPEYPDKWIVQVLQDGYYRFDSGRHTLDEAKKICIHLSQGPFYPSLNPDHS